MERLKKYFDYMQKLGQKPISQTIYVFPDALV